MALIAPLAGAALGGLLTGWAGWGLSVGWLVGSWLFGPKAENDNKVFDPGAEEMPSFNQALRGSTLPILFGTNRVSTQVVWQKNFTTIRHESSKGGGGGKGGGSGLGNKAGSPETSEVTYTYKWDLLFHIGMNDQQFNLFGGWLATERLNDSTLLAISDSQASSSIFGLGTSRPQNAELSFESAFFQGNAETGANVDPWSNFQTEEGGPYRWPYTSYIGFKQLNLGSSAHVPQMSWEVGPGGITYSVNENASPYVEPSTFALYDSLDPQPFYGRDGTLYLLVGGGGASNIQFTVINPATDTSTYYQTADAQADFDADPVLPTNTIGIGGSIVSADLTCSGFANVLHADDGDYIISKFSFDVISTTIETAFFINQVDENGNIVLVGAYLSTTDSLSDLCDGIFYLTNEHTTTDAIAYLAHVTVGATDVTKLYRLPSIDDMKSVVIEANGSLSIRGGNSAYSGGYLSSVLNTDSRPNQYALTNDIYTSSKRKGVHYIHDYGPIIPYVTIGVGISWANRVFFKYDYDAFVDIAAAPGLCTHEDNLYADYGGEETIHLYFDFNDGGYGTLDIQPFTILNNGLVVAPETMWEDLYGNTFDWDSIDCYDRDSVRDRYNYYQRGGYAQRLQTGVGQGAYLYIVAKNMDYRTNDWGWVDGCTHTKVEVFVWNPITQKFIHFGGLELSPIDATASTVNNGFGLPDCTYQATDSGINCWWDETLEKLWLASGNPSLGGTGGGVWIADAMSLDIAGGTDVAPPYIIYKILTSPIYGLGYSASDIDQNSYSLSLLYCEDQDIAVSVQYRREESALAIIDELLSLYGGFLTDKAGKIYFGLQEFTQTPIRTINNDHLLIDQDGEAPVQVVKGARQDTYNRVKVNYFDRALEYRQNFIELSDEVDMDINGVRAQEFPAKFVMKESTALKIATRALWGNLYARDIYQFKLGPKDADLEPGDVITLVDSYNTNLSAGKQVRIVEWQETQPLKFSVKAVDEIEYINASTTAIDSATEASSNALFGPSAPPAYFQMYELPKEYQGADARLFVGYRQQSAAMGARLYVSADGVSYTQTDDKQPYIISGILAAGLPSRDPGYVEENIEVYLMPDTRSSAFNPATPTYCQTFALEDGGSNARALGATALWINSEMVAYEGANLVAQNHYRFDRLYRGWGGTHIQAHGSGDTFWRHAGGVFTQILNQDKVGNIFYYKVQPYNFAGVGYNISSIDAKTYQIQGTYWKPQNPGALRTFVQSPGSYVTIQSEDLNFITKKKVISGGSPVQIEWPDSSRDSGYGALGNGYLTYGEFLTDITSHNYRIQVYSSDGTTVVRCTTVSTLAFLYTVDANSTDFNGWAGSFRVKVTPYNTYGDALRSRTKILELFE